MNISVYIFIVKLFNKKVLLLIVKEKKSEKCNIKLCYYQKKKKNLTHLKLTYTF